MAVAAVVAVLVLAWVLSRRIAVVVSGLLLLAILLVSAWLSGGWVNAALIAVIAVVAVPVFAWARSGIKRDSRGTKETAHQKGHTDGYA